MPTKIFKNPGQFFLLLKRMQRRCIGEQKKKKIAEKINQARFEGVPVRLYVGNSRSSLLSPYHTITLKNVSKEKIRSEEMQRSC